jgi:tetratricopeptide (TPR) repeat protein
MQLEWIRQGTGEACVVFVHGILSSGEGCWRHPNGSYWPELLRSEPAFSSLGICVFTYRTGIFSGSYSLGDVVDALKEFLRLDAVLDCQRIIFVCHSMGGLVVRKFVVECATELVEAKKEIDLFLVASPSLGSSYADWLSPLANALGHAQADALRFVRDNQWLKDLDKEFMNLKEGRRLRLRGKELVEDTFVVLKKLLRRQVVEPFAGSRYFGDAVKIPGSDHFSIAKPQDARAFQHRLLCRFIQERDRESADPPGEPPPGVKAPETEAKRPGGAAHAIRGAVPYQAPPLPSHYVSRPNLLAGIRSHALAEKSQEAGILPITAVLGTPGGGKSTVAAAFAHDDEVRRRYPDGVFWVTLGPEPQIGPLLRSWVVEGGDPAAETWSENTSVNYLRTTFRDRAALFVIDDVWNEADARPFLVGGTKCHVLLTTRRAQIADHLGASVVQVGEMSSAESFDLIMKRIGPARLATFSDEDRTEARKLLRQIGYLPLAIELVAALIGRGYRWSDVRAQFIDFEAALSETAGFDSPGRRKIEACLALSLAFLNKEDPVAWRAMLWLALLPFEEKIHEAMTCTLWEVDAAVAGRILQKLADDALLKRDEGRYSIHTLMHQTIRRVLSLSSPQGLGVSMREGHARIIDRYRERLVGGHWHTVSDDGYIVSRLVWHFAKAGKYEELFDLLRAQNPDGSNSWYQRRFGADQATGYLEDLKLARGVAVEMRSARHQVFAALCHSSIISRTSNYGSDVMAGLIRRGIWTPVFAFRWILEACKEGEQAEFLIALNHAVNAAATAGRTSDVAGNIAHEALLLAREQLLKRPPTDAAVRSMGRLLRSADTSDFGATLSAIYAWCGVAKASSLVQSIPAAIRQELAEQFSPDVESASDPLEKLVLLASLIRQGAQSKQASRCEQLLDLLRQSAAQLLGATGKDEPSSALPGPSGGGTAFSAARSDVSVSDGASGKYGDESERHRTCEETLQALIPSLPNPVRATASAILSTVENTATVDGLLRRLQYFQGLPTTSGSDTPYALIDSLIDAGRSGEAVDAAMAAVSEADPYPVYKVLPYISAYNVDDILVRLGLLPKPLDPGALAAVASYLASTNPEAYAPRLILSPEALPAEAVVESIGRAGPGAGIRIALACILYGSRESAVEALNAISTIRDRREEVGAALALMPFVPKSEHERLYSGLRDDANVGQQIAGMTEIMLILTSAIASGCLSDVVEATSRLHSEWWVVEALSVTILRVRSIDEMRAVQACVPRIRNLDLRARILERIALRLADLGSHPEAIDACKAIELVHARADALGELGKRFASIGDLASALDAAREIPFSEDASKAYAEIALAAGAQGRTAEALNVVRKYVTDVKWRGLSEAMLNADAMLQSRPRARAAAERNTGEERFTRFKLVRDGILQAKAIAGAAPQLDGILQAAQAEDGTALQAAIGAAWADEGKTDSPICSFLLHLKRQELLKALAALAPIFDVDGDNPDVAPIVESVHAVCRWWP